MSTSAARFTRRWSATAVVALSAAGLVVTGLSPLAAGNTSASAPLRAPLSAPLEAPAPAVPDIAWRGCGGGEPAQCAKVRVPLDYDSPGGAKLTLDVKRARATDPARRIGSLLINPGGPGGASTEFVHTVRSLFEPEVRERFDIIGVDPRGIGGSSPAICRGPGEELPYQRPPFPGDADQVRTRFVFDTAVRKLCREGGAPVLDHMTTADTARDMDLIRRAVGDDQLTYYGISYGTYLGQTYAAMFPDKVRALVIDGVLDPVSWSTGRSEDPPPFSARVGSDFSANEALTSALAACDRAGRPRCALAPNAAAKWRRLVSVTKTDPERLGRFAMSYPDLVSGTLGGLYGAENYRPMFADFARLIAYLDGDRSRALLADVADARVHLRDLGDQRIARGPYAPEQAPITTPAAARTQTWQPFAGVACADSVNPARRAAWPETAAVRERMNPWFGALWTWASSLCAGWPGSSADAYRGPWPTTTSYPLLVVGNTHDPATGIAGARAAHRLFAGSRLITVDHYGHGARQRLRDRAHVRLPRLATSPRARHHLRLPALLLSRGAPGRRPPP